MKTSRQVEYQRLHKAAGLCWSCSREAFLGGSRCVRHLEGNGKYLKLREKWKAVDWSLPNSQIAKNLGVTYVAVYLRRRATNETD